jgi:hypothetical protein
MSFGWEVFGNRNGFDTFNQFQNLIFQYGADKKMVNPQIGCIILISQLKLSILIPYQGKIKLRGCREFLKCSALQAFEYEKG